MTDTTPVTKQATEFSELTPTSYRADSVFTVGDPIARAIYVEVQRAIDRDKPCAWTRYLACLSAEHRVTVDLVVIARNHTVSRWARKVIALNPTFRWTPIVIDPELLAQTDQKVLLEHPQLAMLCIELTCGTRRLSDEVTRSVLDRLRAGGVFR